MNALATLLIEFRTRKVGRDFTEQNIQEFINTLFPLIEAIRRFLKDYNSDPKLITMSLALCQDMLNFQDKWHTSYTSWISMFKSSSAFKNEAVKGRKFLFYETQNYFGDLREILDDIEIMNSEIEKFLTICHDINITSSSTLIEITKPSTLSKLLGSFFK